MRTPYVQQWNLGGQYEVTKNFLIEIRYVGSKGAKLLQATSFAQGFDLNDPNTPDFIYERFNRAYVAGGSPLGPLNAGTTARQRGLGKAFGFPNSTLGGIIDLNLANPSGAVITFEGRSPFLGFDVPEAILLGNSAYSTYHSAQLSLTKRLSRGLQFNAAYTFSKSIDNASADPGSTAGGYPNNRGFGNLGRNILRGFSQKRIDLGLAKNTRITERVGLEFRWDVFNVLNNVNFATPNNVIGETGTDFGKITDTIGGPRVMQFGMKLITSKG